MQSHHPRRHPDVFVQDLGGDRLLSRFDADQLHVLNPMAYQIWLYCDGRHAPADIAAQLAQRFPNASPDRITADVEQVLSELIAKGLLQTPEVNHKENQS